MIKIAVYNNKGGVGKTTSAFNIGAVLAADYGKRVLMVDLDPQGDLSFKIAGEISVNKSGKFDEDGKPVTTLEDIMSGKPVSVIPYDYRVYDREAKKSKICSMDLIPCTDELAMIDYEDLRSILSPIEDKYDFCIFDMAPGLTDLTYIGLYAADYLLTPAKLEDNAVKAIFAVQKYFNQSKAENPALKFLGVFYADYEPSKELMELSDQINQSMSKILFKSAIRHSKEVINANALYIPAISLTGSRGEKDYRALVAEIIDKIGE